MFDNIWSWLKRLWQRLFGAAPKSEPEQQVSTPMLSNTEYENAFFKLLDEVDQGASWGSLKGWLLIKEIPVDGLVRWLEGFAQTLAEQDTPDVELIRRITLLGQVAVGSLGHVASDIAQRFALPEPEDDWPVIEAEFEMG